MALECWVRILVTLVLKLLRSWEVAVPSSPRAFAIAFCNEPRWSAAAAAITPLLSEHASKWLYLPLVILTFATFHSLCVRT